MEIIDLPIEIQMYIAKFIVSPTAALIKEYFEQEDIWIKEYFEQEYDIWEDAVFDRYETLYG